MTLLVRLLEAIGRRAPLALVGGIVFSLLVPTLSFYAAPFLPAIVVGTLTMAFARIDLARALGQWRRPDRIAVSLLLIMVAMPVAVAFAAPALGISAALVLGLVLLAASPPLASGASFAFIMGLDAELAVNLVLAGTLAMPFIAPPLVFYALDLGLDVDVFAIFVRLAVSVALAVLIAGIIRYVAGRERIVRRAKAFDGVAALWMILFLVAIMDGVPALMVGETARAVAMFTTGAVANFGFPLLILAICWFVPQRQSTEPAAGMATVAMFAGNRNLGLVLTALPAGLYAEIGPFVALYQIPIYLTPMLMGPVFRKFIGPEGAVSQT